jgi:hypothetical protein
MQPNRLGRVLGIGTRIAAKKLRETSARMDRGIPAPAPVQEVLPPRSRGTASRAAAAARPARTKNFVEGSRRAGRGAGKFGAALLGPFAHATGVLTLQIFGCFFVLFALYFASHVWKSYQLSGWHDRHILVYAGIALLFTWFAASSFWRASRKQAARG